MRDTVSLEIPAGKLRPATLVGCLLIVALTAGVLWLWLPVGGWADQLGASRVVAWCVAILFLSVMFWLFLLVYFRPPVGDAALLDLDREPYGPEDYLAADLGPMTTSDAKHLYLELMKRAVSNILYQDAPMLFYSSYRDAPKLAAGFSLPRRVAGEDCPRLAHSMIGKEGLDNIQYCVEQVLEKNVSGDLIETGVYRGGAVIFMRAILKVHCVNDRRVFACDTFLPAWPDLPHWTVMPYVQALASIPSEWWQRKFLLWLEKLPRKNQAFPVSAEPSKSWVAWVMWMLRNPSVFRHHEKNSLEKVKSRFARYGLLDDQVQFLEGFFADTLPAAPIERLAVMRLDGDTYESTMDAIKVLYPKLSPGGFCIVDDYRLFADCERAIDEYRAEHQIHDEMLPVGKHAVYWQRRQSP